MPSPLKSAVASAPLSRFSDPGIAVVVGGANDTGASAPSDDAGAASNAIAPMTVPTESSRRRRKSILPSTTSMENHTFTSAPTELGLSFGLSGCPSGRGSGAWRRSVAAEDDLAQVAAAG